MRHRRAGWCRTNTTDLPLHCCGGPESTPSAYGVSAQETTPKTLARVDRMLFDILEETPEVRTLAAATAPHDASLDRMAVSTL
jgi:hypothetical protein